MEERGGTDLAGNTNNILEPAPQYAASDEACAKAQRADAAS